MGWLKVSLQVSLRAPRRVKTLSPTAIAQADEAYDSLAIRAFRRLTASLRGPKLCLSPQPHRVRHELRPPALATPARHPGSGPPLGRRIAPSLHPRGVGGQGDMAKPGVRPGTASVCGRQEKTPPILPFTTQMESDQRPSLCWRDAPGPEERFCRRIRPADDVFRCAQGTLYQWESAAGTGLLRARLFALLHH